MSQNNALTHGKFYEVIAWFPLLYSCRFVEFDTSVICHVLVYCFGSFLLQDMFLNLQVFAFEGQDMTLTVNMLLTCTLLLWRRSRLWLELFASTVGKFLSRVSYAFASFQVEINLKFHVTLRSLIGLFNWFFKSDKRQNVAGGNFTRGFAAREIPRGHRPRENMAASPPLPRSRIPPATQAKTHVSVMQIRIKNWRDIVVFTLRGATFS